MRTRSMEAGIQHQFRTPGKTAIEVFIFLVANSNAISVLGQNKTQTGHGVSFLKIDVSESKLKR